MVVRRLKHGVGETLELCVRGLHAERRAVALLVGRRGPERIEPEPDTADHAQQDADRPAEVVVDALIGLLNLMQRVAQCVMQQRRVIGASTLGLIAAQR